MDSVQARALQQNIRYIYAMAFFQSAMIVTAVFVPIMQRHGLSMSQVLLTQSLFALVVAVLEVPSGYLADLWGRRKTIVLGCALNLLAFVWLVYSDSFFDFLVYETVMAIGISLNSGADLALLFDSQRALQAERQSDELSRGNHISRLVAIEGYAGATAALAAGALAYLSLDWVLIVQCLVSAAGLVVSLALVEAPRQISICGHRENLRRVYRAIQGNAVVAWTGLAIIVFGCAALFAFWIYQKYWEAQHIPVHWFGYIWAVHCIIRGVTAHQANFIEQRLGTCRVLALIAVLPVVGFIGMGTLGGWIGLAFGLLCPISRGLSVVIFYDALNHRVDAEFRATINSLVSLGTRSVFIVTGPLLGYLIDSQGVNNCLLILAIVFIPVFAVVLIPLIVRIQRDNAAAGERLSLS